MHLELARHSSPTAGLAEGLADVAIVRIPVDEKRFDRRGWAGAPLVTFASDDAQWAPRRQFRMAEIAGPIVSDPRVGTTSDELWAAADRPTQFIEIADVDAWLDVIAAGRGVCTTAEGP